MAAPKEATGEVHAARAEEDRRAEDAGGQELRITRSKLLLAVKSLYPDQLKPCDRLIRRRVREHAGQAAALRAGRPVESADVTSVPLVNVERLLDLCHECRLYVVQQDEGDHQGFVAYLTDRPCKYVDIGSAEDPYMPEMWTSLAMYFGSLSGAEACFPAGRYDCAVVLARRDVPCLAGRSLGEICHIVGLALGSRQLLSRVGGHVVPLPEECAPNDMPPGLDLQPASWLQVREGLKKMLAASGGELQLSLVKNEFRRRFAMELDEAELGHARLRDLLLDPRLRDMLEVRPESVVLAAGGVPHEADSRPLLCEVIVPLPDFTAPLLNMQPATLPTGPSRSGSIPGQPSCHAPWIFPGAPWPVPEVATEAAPGLALPAHWPALPLGLDAQLGRTDMPSPGVAYWPQAPGLTAGAGAASTKLPAGIEAPEVAAVSSSGCTPRLGRGSLTQVSAGHLRKDRLVRRMSSLTETATEDKDDCSTADGSDDPPGDREGGCSSRESDDARTPWAAGLTQLGDARPRFPMPASLAWLGGHDDHKAGP